MDGSSGVIEEISNIVTKIAPTLAGLLSGNFVSVGLSLLTDLFSVRTGDVSGLKQAITNDPEAALKLKTLAYQHQAAIAQISAGAYQTEVQDRMDARRNAPVFHDFMRHLAWFVTAGFLAATFLLFLPLQLSSEEKNLLSMLVGMLASKWQTIMDFFYGSSSRQTNIKE